MFQIRSAQLHAKFYTTRKRFRLAGVLFAFIGTTFLVKILVISPRVKLLQWHPERLHSTVMGRSSILEQETRTGTNNASGSVVNETRTGSSPLGSSAKGVGVYANFRRFTPASFGNASYSPPTLHPTVPHTPAAGSQYLNPLEALRARNVQVTLLSRHHVPLLANNETDSTSPPFVVPNLVHFIWFEPNRSFKFTHYLSFLSVQRYLAPDLIFLHGDALPVGPWWKRTVREVDNLYSVYREMPRRAPSGAELRFLAHAADVTRLDVLIEHGGIYLDSDIFVLKSFDALRLYPFVLGRETSYQLGNGIIVSAQDAPFLRLWFESYSSYGGPGESWAYRSTMLPNKMAETHSDLIHVEETSLQQPNWEESGVRQLYLGHYDWSGNYAIHVWQRTIPVQPPQSPADVDRLNTTIGEIARHVLYRSKELRS